MKAFVCAVVGLLCFPPSIAKSSPPMVEVYSQRPGDVGKKNTLICHVTNFYPPEISIELLKNYQVMPGANNTDLAFEENWHYHLTKSIPFTPHKGDSFACRVTHMKKSSMYIWEPDM
ncbi:beta-2-microglobulin [Cyclopterus lumpus]|uniref:Beta-2-microglobulin n=1 Tax=Cyclopterus lumpus TaxID=8103 RepID=A0A8C3A517_CYCLU|nr:beta-2-microglobulin [Cyclopterus lumpus]